MNLKNIHLLIRNKTDSLMNHTIFWDREKYDLDSNGTNDENVMYPVTLVIPITVIYVIIFIAGLIGNVSTCIVIIKNKSMHTATNYYLCSLAISDLLLLISGLPPEMYRIWSPEVYVFGEVFCILQGYAAETSANATVLTITAFTVERYLAICHPFLSHTMSKLSRVVKYVIAIWIAALCLAAPQAMQFGVEYDQKADGVQRSRCTVVAKTFYFRHAFEISTFLFFIGPMTLITVLYVLIAIKLRKSRLLSIRDTSFNSCVNDIHTPRVSKNTAGQKRVVKMLVAVVAAFFICWAPFHAQRLLAVYLADASPADQEMFIGLYIVLMHTSGILYFVSTTVNPVLYHIMSKKFRDAFKATFSQLCHLKSSRRYNKKMYSSLLRHPQSFRTCKATPLERIQQNNAPNLHNVENEKNRSPTTEPTSNKPVMKETVLSERTPTNKVFRARIASESSQITIATSISNSGNSASSELKSERRKLARSVSAMPQINKRRSNLSSRKCSSILNNKMFKLFKRHNLNENRKFLKQKSIESIRSNTISNSSLQDMEDGEFDSSELAEYMKQVNSELS